VFNCHLRLKVESGDDAELFDRTTAGGRSSFVDPRSNPGTKGKRAWRTTAPVPLYDISSLNHLGCYIYKDIFIDLIIKECGEWVERKSEDVFFFFSFFRQNQERISLARAPEKRGGKSLEDRDGKNSSSTGVKSLLTCNEVLARIVKSRWLVSGACGRFP